MLKITGLSKILILKVIKIDNNKVIRSNNSELILFKFENLIKLSKYN